jgi:hypothetical protein
MMRFVKHCAPSSRMTLWRARVLAFLAAALAGLVVPSGCVVVPEGGYPDRASIECFFCGPKHGCPCGEAETSCGAPSDECGPASCPIACQAECTSECPAECTRAECRPPRRKLWEHLPKCHLYDPEAGIFNFCIPPQCINPPPPLPPGRFFPVPSRPAFAQRGDVDYSLLNSQYDRSKQFPPACAPCP